MNDEKEPVAVEAKSTEPNEGIELPTDTSASKKIFFLQLILGIIISGLIVTMFFLGYRLLPNNQKIMGNWQSDDTTPYKLKIAGNKANLSIEELNGVQGVRLELQSSIIPVDSSHYSGKNTVAFLIIDKKQQDKQVLEAMKQQDNYYKLEKETKKKLVLKYTPEANIAAFGVEDLDTSFNFEANDWQYGILPRKIHFQNDAFALNGLSLMKQK